MGERIGDRVRLMPGLAVSPKTAKTKGRRRFERYCNGMSRRELHQFGAMLRHARKVKQLRLKDVASEVGCSESFVSKLECGKVTPSLRMLHDMTTVLDTSIASLFADHEGASVTIYRAAIIQSSLSRMPRKGTRSASST